MCIFVIYYRNVVLTKEKQNQIKKNILFIFRYNRCIYDAFHKKKYLIHCCCPILIFSVIYFTLDSFVCLACEQSRYMNINEIKQKNKTYRDTNTHIHNLQNKQLIVNCKILTILI